MTRPANERQIIRACNESLQALLCASVNISILDLSTDENVSPDTRALLETTQLLIQGYAEATDFIGALAKGNINVEPPRKNHLIAPYKELHASLQSLVWQIQQVADGNYNLRIDFLGRVSDSFNRMVAALADKRRIEAELSLSEARSLRAETVAKAGHWEWHPDEGTIYGSPGVYKIFGMENQPLTLDSTLDVVLPEERSRVYHALRQLVEGDEPYDIEFRITRRIDGQILDVHSIAEYDRARRIVFGIIQDISARKCAERALDYQHRFQKMIAEISSDFINADHDDLDARIDKMLQSTGEFFQVDRAYLFQFSADGKYMNNTHEWVSAGIDPEIGYMQNLPLDSFPWWANQVRENKNVYIPDVSRLPPEAAAEKEEFQRQGIQTILCVPISRENKVIGIFGFDSVRAKRVWEDDQVFFFKVAANTVSNALLKHKLEQELIESAVTDQLTSLFNRRYLHTHLPPLLEEYKRTKKPVAVAFFDIDHFKKFNDTYGHLAGDFILQQFAQLLKENIRPFDIACRYGGEEFLVLANGAGGTVVSTIAERILEKARTRYFEFDGKRLHLTLSCGVADCTEFGEQALNAETLIDTADRRLYRAKEGGRDRCVYGDDASEGNE